MISYCSRLSKWNHPVRTGGEQFRWFARVLHLVCVIVGVTVGLSVHVALGQSDSDDALEKAYRHLRAAFEEDLLKSAAASQESSSWMRIPNDPSRIYLFVPDEFRGMDPRSGRDANLVGEERTRLAERYANQLVELAVDALKSDQGATAFRWAHEILCYAPNQPQARNWLGLSTTPITRSADRIQIRRPRSSHPRFGWRAGKYRLVSSPHFRIATNDSEESARKLADSLEQLHCVWQQLFFDTWTDTTAWTASWTSPRAGRPVAGRSSGTHQVVLFQTHEQYVAYLKTIEPQAALTRGYYHAPTRTAYFVGGSQPKTATWIHEATHQLFHECQKTVRAVGSQQNFWIVEGAAMYLESLQCEGNRAAVGGLEADRLQMARFRANREGFLLPLQTFFALDQQSWQNHPRIHALYSQSAGVTHFLMHGNRGRLRSQTEQLLKLVYAGRDVEDSIVKLTGMDWAEFDRQYQQFLQVTDDDLVQLDPDIRPHQLCLGATQVTDRGLSQISHLEQCEWLDLFGLNVSDNGTTKFVEARELRQLNLENTPLGDASIARLENATQLRELDLSNTRITDASLATIAKLQNLESLWLTGTAVTDEGLQRIRDLPNLQLLDLNGTRVSEATINYWRERLPAPTRETSDENTLDSLSPQTSRK